VQLNLVDRRSDLGCSCQRCHLRHSHVGYANGAHQALYAGSSASQRKAHVRPQVVCEGILVVTMAMSCQLNGA
jgi:hypothetical protein